MTAPSSSGSGSTPDGDSTGPSPSLLKSVQARAASAAAGTPLLRAVFMGTPAFAAIILKAMLESRQLSLAAVFTQPDRPAGRGKRQCPPPVKLLAVERGLPVFQPPHFRPGQEGDAAVASLAALEPDVLLVAAYGLILPQRVLDIPRLMAVNVHASLLPRHRGAAPIQRAVMAGDNVTGVSIMRMEAGLDTGPLLLQRAVGIDINDTSATLHDELAREGAELLELALERLRAGALQPFAQDESRATYAAKLRKEEGQLDFSLPVRTLHARIRGLVPWPGACMTLRRAGRPPLAVGADPGFFPLSPGMRQAVEAFAPPCGSPAAGAVIGLVEGALLVSCADGGYAFTRLRPAGRGAMDAAPFYNGYLAGAVSPFFADD